MEIEVPKINVTLSKVTYEEITPSFGKPYISFNLYFNTFMNVSWNIDKEDFIKMADGIKGSKYR